MKKLLLITAFTFITVIGFSCEEEPAVDTSKKRSVLTGADLLLSEKYDLIKGKKLGIVTNHTAVLRNGVHLVDTLSKKKDVTIKALFGPEHGIRGINAAGENIESSVDPVTGIPVYSLYGETYKPAPETLDSIDMLIFDIQDIGARFYTYISTMYYVLEAAAENEIPVIVLDRPNPITGVWVDGPIREEKFKTFVGIAPIPIMHGMTVGELAQMFNSEGFLANNLKAELTVVKLKYWQRGMFFDQCGLPWISPSPNIPELKSAIVYPGTCLLEGTNISEGRGTYDPFVQVGAPYIDSKALIEEMGKHNLQGAKLEEVEFTPESIENMSPYPKYEGEACYGIKIAGIDRADFNPVKFGLVLIYAIRKLNKEFEFKKEWFDKLTGTTRVREMLEKDEVPAEIMYKWNEELQEFRKTREKYLLY